MKKRTYALDKEGIYAYNKSMRRRPNTLTPFESELLDTAGRLWREGVREFHGFLMEKTIGEARLSRISNPSRPQKIRAMVGYGTLYRALDRLETMGYLQSRWEKLPNGEGRPRRRYYRLAGSEPNEP